MSDLAENVFTGYRFAPKEGVVRLSESFPEFHNRVRIDKETNVLTALDLIKVLTNQIGTHCSRTWKETKENHPMVAIPSCLVLY